MFMDIANDPQLPDAEFHAVLTPHRSLGRKGFRTLMLILLGCWFATGLVFVTLGAWPIFGFFGLDVAAVYLAFRVNYRSARCHEEVRLSRHELMIRKVGVSGKTVKHSLNPFWTKLRVSKHPYAGVTKLQVASREARVSIGDFLNPDDRASFAKAFGLALANVKRG
jgi:uncharacterized membrane protein